MPEFINPYTFVPLPEVINRAAPTGHDKARAGHVSGTMTVTWTLSTPLLLPAAHPPVKDGRVVIPGASVKGAVRSLHETLMGGCLRVLDEEFVPVYRQPAVAQDGNWWLGVVRESTRDGRATRIEVTVDRVWVPIEGARRALGRPPRSGDTVGIDEEQIWKIRSNRYEVSQAGVHAGRDWVLLVGDSKTRRDSHRFFCAAGALTNDESDVMEVSPEVWETYTALCENTYDMRRIRSEKGPKGWRTRRMFTDVTWKGEKVGERRVVTGLLWPGDVLWVHLNPETNTIDGLSMAAIWRVRGAGPMGERVPADVRACDDWHRLCLSCRLFGSADTRRADGDEEADQRSYAGHVRFGDAVAGQVTTEHIERFAPLSAPRPGAGQFYLDIKDVRPAAKQDELPTAYWGSSQDSDGWRRVRGRKFYWHGDPAAQRPPRHIARPEQRNEAMTGSRDLVPAGTVFTQRISFDNISKAELGSLLLTLLPALALPGEEGLETADYALRLGGGKPLGLGSCRVAVRDLKWWDASSRYSGGDSISMRPEELFAVVREEVVELAGPAVRKQWPVISRVLRSDAVDPQLIWYPLGGDGPKRDRSYDFFSRTNGQFRSKRQPIVPLPDPRPGISQVLRSR